MDDRVRDQNKSSNNLIKTEPSILYKHQTSVDLNQVKHLVEITTEDRSWVKSLGRGLKFKGKVYFAQLTDCPILHKEKQINNSVYYIKELDRYLIIFDDQDLCYDPSHKLFGLLLYGSRFNIPNSKTICFLKDIGAPRIGMFLTDGKRVTNNLRPPVIKESIIEWTFR